MYHVIRCFQGKEVKILGRVPSAVNHSNSWDKKQSTYISQLTKTLEFLKSKITCKWYSQVPHFIALLWSGRLFGDGDQLDSLEERVLFNDKLANENFVTIEKNEALISTESKLNSFQLDQLSSETSKLQKLIIGQFLSLKMSQSNQDYHIKLQSEMLIYYDKLNVIALSLLETENNIS